MAQTYQNWELLIQDDCSMDNTKEVVEKFIAENPECKNKIKYECNQKNSGAAITRNNALRRAKGRWIAFLDSDDLWLPEKLEKQLRFMVENGYKFSYTAYREMDNDSRETGVEIHGPKHVKKLGMFAFCWPGCLTVMYDRRKVGLVQIADLKKHNDYAIWLKVAKKADCLLLPEVLGRYRIRTSSVSHGVGFKGQVSHLYALWQQGEGMVFPHAAWRTFVNLVFGAYKKLKYASNCD